MNEKLNIKNKWWLIIPAAGIIILIISLILPDTPQEKAEFGKAEISLYSETLEEKIKNLISGIDGVGEVSVMLTLDCSSEYVFAENRDVSDSRRVSDYLVITGDSGESAVQVKEIYPRVRGVAVVCDGGDSVEVEAKIISALSSSLGIASNRITVCS